MVQTLEGVNFSKEVYTDQLRYGTLKGLIKKCMPIGLRNTYINVRQAGGAHKRIKLNFTPSNAKFINQYTFLGLLIIVDQVNAIATMDATLHQPINITNITADSEFVACAVHVSYNERNPDFHMSKV